MSRYPAVFHLRISYVESDGSQSDAEESDDNSYYIESDSQSVQSDDSEFWSDSDWECERWFSVIIFDYKGALKSHDLLKIQGLSLVEILLLKKILYKICFPV